MDARRRQILGDLLAFVDETAALGWADRLIDEHRSLGAILASRQEALQRVTGSRHAAVFLGLLRTAFRESLEFDALDGPVLSSNIILHEYLSATMAHSDVEELRVIYLNARNHLLCNEIVSRGSVSETVLSPRAVVRRALEVGATSLILVHNHPSGDPSPSEADIEMTIRVVAACRTLEITLNDHVIVARSGCSSFRALGLL